jgi:hypothetical protein
MKAVHCPGAGLLAAAVTSALSMASAARADPFVATLPVTISGPTSLVPVANPLNVQLSETYGPYTATVTNNTDVSLTVDYAVMSLISPDGAVQSTIGGWLGFLPSTPGNPTQGALSLAPGQSAEYSAARLYAVGSVGDTAELAFWTEYSSFPADPNYRGGCGPGAGTNFATYECAAGGPSWSKTRTFSLARNASTRRILRTRRREILDMRSSAVPRCSI